MTEQATFHSHYCRCVQCKALRAAAKLANEQNPVPDVPKDFEDPGPRPPCRSLDIETRKAKVVPKCQAPPYTDYTRSLPTDMQRDLDTLALSLNLLLPHDVSAQQACWLYVVAYVEKAELDAVGP
jgi:hypothetical protein